MKQYKAAVQERINRQIIRNRQLEVEEVELFENISRSIEDFDLKLHNLYETKLEVEKCVLAEELKILLYIHHIGKYDQLEKEQSEVTTLLEDANKLQILKNRELTEGKKILKDLKEELATLKETDRLMEKNLKKEFPGLGFNQLEAIIKAFKKRPRGIGSNRSRPRTSISQQDPALMGPSVDSILGKNPRDLQAKSVSAALQRMSIMFRETMMKKAPKSSTVMAISLEDMDKPTNCPENIDMDSWKTLCRLRRTKIQSEEAIINLENIIVETEEVVNEREKDSEKAEEEARMMNEKTQIWRKERNFNLNNIDIVLSIEVGQMEAISEDFQPNIPGIVLINEGVITKLNNDILSLGESKLGAMTESMEFRRGTRTLLWEQERLNMEQNDLRENWKEIQQTKLTKENRDILQDNNAGGRSNLAQEYTHLDKTSKGTAKYLSGKISQLDKTLEDIRSKSLTKEKENEMLEQEIRQMEEVNLNLEHELEDMKIRHHEALNPKVIPQVMKRNQLVTKIKQQHDLLNTLQRQLDTYMFKSFPSLG